MADEARITQVGLEVAEASDSQARVTQVGLEVAVLVGAQADFRADAVLDTQWLIPAPVQASFTAETLLDTEWVLSDLGSGIIKIGYWNIGYRADAHFEGNVVIDPVGSFEADLRYDTEWLLVASITSLACMTGSDISVETEGEPVPAAQTNYVF